MSITSSRTAAGIALRTALALLVLAALGALLTTTTRQAFAEALSPVPRTESLLVGLLGALGLLLLARLAWLVVASVGPLLLAALRGREIPRPRPTRGLGRVVVGLVLGAGALAPQLASAAPASRPTGVVRAVAAADDGPVDPTYLGPSVVPAPAAARASAPARPATQAPAGARGAAAEVVVRPGDTLWGLAKRRLESDRRTEAGDAEVVRLVGAIYAANHGVIGPDPDLILPGTRLVLPAASGASATTPGGAR